jgi:hypothetical protein
MGIYEYCGEMEYSILQFIFSSTNHIREKIEKKELFYKEQIVRYVQQQIDFFFKAYHLKSALLQTYKYEIYNTIMFKLKNILKEHHFLQCI